MPSSIPYHSSLVLGAIVNPDLFKKIKEMTSHTEAINAAEEKLNSLIKTYRNINMVSEEIKSLDTGISSTENKNSDTEINTEELEKQKNTLKETIAKAAANYAEVQTDREQKIEEIKASFPSEGLDLESPLDYSRVKPLKIPLAADSLKLDYQYFSIDRNEENAGVYNNIKNFVKGATESTGKENSKKATEAVLNQVKNQHQNHNITGTAILTATCTHKNIVMLEPFILNVSKAITAWNFLYKDNPIDTDHLIEAKKFSEKSEESIGILSGAVYGSCLIGMVHIVKNDETKLDQPLDSLAKSVQKQLDLGKWMANEIGGIGVDPLYEKNIKDLLRTQTIRTHLNIISMGVIPSIASNKVQLAAETLSDVDLKNFTDSLDEDESSSTIKSKGNNSRHRAQTLSAYNTVSKNLITSLNEIESENNKVLDINTMITTFENYIKVVTSSNNNHLGVPINYYIKNITKSDIEKLWVQENTFKSSSSNKEKKGEDRKSEEDEESE